MGTWRRDHKETKFNISFDDGRAVGWQTFASSKKRIGEHIVGDGRTIVDNDIMMTMMTMKDASKILFVVIIFATKEIYYYSDPMSSSSTMQGEGKLIVSWTQLKSQVTLKCLIWSPIKITVHRCRR